jgi:capsular exopolysaccharide synthesis family protein
MDRPKSRPARQPASRHVAEAIGQLDLRQGLVVLRSHILVALSIALVVCTLLGWQQLSQPKVYSASAQLVFDPRRHNPVLRQEEFDRGPDEDRIMTLVGEFKSRDLVERVVKSLTPEESARVLAAYFPAGAPNPGQALRTIARRSISANREPESLLITVTATHRDPEAAALLASRFTEQFAGYLLDKSSASNNAALVFLRSQAEDLRKKLEASERALQEYRARYDMVSLDDSQNIVVDRLKALNSSATGARIARSELDVRLQQAEAAVKQQSNPVDLATLTDFPALSDVQHRIDDLKARRAVLAERYGRRHPLMQENARTLEALERLRGEQVAAAIENLRSRRDKAAAEEKELAAQLADAEAAALRLDQIGVDYGVLKRGLETQKQIYTEILSQLNEASIAAQIDSVNVRVADLAEPNYTPISPNVRKVTLTLAALGLAILIGYPFGVELLFGRVRSGMDVENFLESPLLGEIGSVRRIAEEDRPHVVTKDKDSPVAEQFRALYSQLKLTSKIDPPKTVMVTSTLPSEGKSFIASNLAAEFVAHGRRVLLIDADLRRPAQHRHYGVDNRSGILRWLEEGGSPEIDLEKDIHLGILEVSPRLFLLRAGGNSRRATELISTERLTGLFAGLARKFDVLILDTPPAGVFPDAIAFAGVCQELVFVCRFGVASRHQVRGVLTRLRQTDLELAGVVLNALPTGRGTGYYYYHSYGSAGRYARHYTDK